MKTAFYGRLSDEAHLIPKVRVRTYGTCSRVPVVEAWEMGISVITK